MMDGGRKVEEGAGGVEKGKDERQSRQPSSDSVRTRAPGHTARPARSSPHSARPAAAQLRPLAPGHPPLISGHPRPRPRAHSLCRPRRRTRRRRRRARQRAHSRPRPLRPVPGDVRRAAVAAHAPISITASPEPRSVQRGSAAWAIIQSIHGAVSLFADDAAGNVRRPGSAFSTSFPTSPTAHRARHAQSQVRHICLPTVEPPVATAAAAAVAVVVCGHAMRWHGSRTPRPHTRRSRQPKCQPSLNLAHRPRRPSPGLSRPVSPHRPQTASATSRYPSPQRRRPARTVAPIDRAPPSPSAGLWAAHRRSTFAPYSWSRDRIGGSRTFRAQARAWMGGNDLCVATSMISEG
ncbi:hypothetical protein BD413DRAFT_282757 [Trametes elegans]|nr:hypothetical protein BD413DRAFT_282757 [Trametes elegans]